MKRRNAVDYLPAALLASAVVANIVNDHVDRGTICWATRPLWPTVDHADGTRRISPVGRALVAGALAGFAGWFLPHYVNGEIS